MHRFQYGLAWNANLLDYARVMVAKQFNLCREFSDAPGGRYRQQGDFSGQEFREDFLIPLLKQSDLIVDLDGALGLPASFLDEAFGELARKNAVLAKRLSVKLTDNKVAQQILSESLPAETLLWLRK